MDREFARALGEPGGALLPSRLRMKDLATMTNGRVLLTTLSVRTSAKGRPYLSGFLGKSRVVAFAGEPDRFGNSTWDVFVAAPEPREGAPAGRQGASGPGVGSASADMPASASARPGGRYQAPRRAGARAQQERTAAEVLRDYGDRELNDAIDF